MSSFVRKLRATSESIKQLFVKLNAIREKQEARQDVTGLSAEFDSPLEQKERAKTTVISALHEDITLLMNAAKLTSDFYSSIRIPEVKDLLKASDLDIIEKTIADLDGACAHCDDCSANYSGNGGGGCDSDHGIFGHFTNFGHNSKCDDFGNFVGNFDAGDSGNCFDIPDCSTNKTEKT